MNLMPPSAEEEARADRDEILRRVARLQVAHSWCPACAGAGDVLGIDGARDDCPFADVHSLLETVEIRP